MLTPRLRGVRRIAAASPSIFALACATGDSDPPRGQIDPPGFEESAPAVKACAAVTGSKSSYGCDFYGMRVDTMYGGSCYAMMVANAGTGPAHLGLEHDGAELDVARFTRLPRGQGPDLVYDPYDPERGLLPGEVAILFLAHNPVDTMGVLFALCPVEPAIPDDVPVRGTGRGKAFHLVSDEIISAYQIYPYGGGAAAETSATLLLPTHVWDRDHVAINAYPQAYHGAPPTLTIVGKEDQTEVVLTPTVDVVAGEPIDGTFLEGAAKGEDKHYVIGAGEYLQFSQTAELTGSRIASDKPVGVFGGSTCLNVPATTCCCDTAQQQIPPIVAMGAEYVAVRHRDRHGTPETVLWRFVGVAEDTQLTYAPSRPTGAPERLARGELVEVWTSQPFVVRSQDTSHPFYLGAYMTGSGEEGTGDAEWVNVTPTGQFLQDVTFFTDPTYPETSLVVVRGRDETGAFADVDLACAGAVTGWAPVGDYEYTWVRVAQGNYEGVGACANGAQRMTSQGPFGVTVWGWGSPDTGGLFSSGFSMWVSYAYPAAAGLERIAEVPR